MPRRLTIQTKEMDKIDLYLIYDYGGVWESEWRPLQGHDVTKLFTHVAHDTIEHAILGWSSPLVKSLGLFPEGCLHKLPSRECHNAKTCSLYVKGDCRVTAKKKPWCFEPLGFEESDARRLMVEAIRLWRERVYVVVVEEPIYAARR